MIGLLCFVSRHYGIRIELLQVGGVLGHELQRDLPVHRREYTTDIGVARKLRAYAAELGALLLKIAEIGILHGNRRIDVEADCESKNAPAIVTRALRTAFHWFFHFSCF